MLGKENTRKQTADNQMDVDAFLTHSATGEQHCEDRLSSEFQDRLSWESQENLGPSSASSGNVWHSALNDNESIANAASNEIMEKAAFFVRTFVRKFEKKISECSEEVEPDSKIKKTGKIADKVTSVLNDSIPPGIWKPVLKETSKHIVSLTAEKHKEREKRFYAIVVPFKDKQREILVNASLEVFQKFEQQFTQVVDVYPPSWERGMSKLAIDAVSRAKNYILNSNKIEEFSANLITKGIIFGESKNSFPISYSEHQMEDEEFNEALSTSGLYEEVGVKRINEHNTKKHYRLKKYDNTEKYGYRLPFDYESEEWCEIGKYAEVNCLPEEEYEYILDDEKKKKLADSILEKINREDPVKKEDTQKIKEDTQEIKELCKEIKNNQKDKSTRSFSFNLGQLPRSFIKRKTMLNELTTKLCSENQEVEMSRKVLISGEHGIGKSELARSYAHSKESDGSNVWTKAVWIDARTHDTLLNSFCSLAEELKISTQNAAYHNVVRDREIKSIVKDVYKEFQDEKTLFVFDGAGNYEKIEKFLPSSFSDLFFGKEKPYILITSRQKDWEERMEKVELDKGFSLEEGIKFVRKTLKIQDRSQDECMISFIKALNYLPLALAQATAHINKIAQKKPNISEYLERYKKALKESNPDLLIALGISEELFIPLKGNFDKMEKEGNIAQQLQNVYTAMIYLNLNHVDIEKFSFQKKSGKGKQQVLDTLNPLNKISVAELKELIAKVHKKPIIAKKEGTEKETLREIMISLMNSGITNVSHIIFIWSHISKYKELVSEFIDLIYDNGCSILHLLSANNSKEVVKLILEKVDLSKLSESINNADKMGFAPLDYASMRGSLDMVKYLIEKGADFKRDNCDFIPLYCAALCGQLEIVKYFIDNKYFELDELDRMGNTSLHYAVIHCHLCIVEYLVEKGADVNLQDKKGLSSLHFAVQSGHLDIVKYLIEKEADVNLQDEYYMSSLHYAAKNGHLDIVKCLVEKGASDKDYMRSLYIAAQSGHLDIIKYLIEKVVSVSLQDENYINPLHIAAQNGHLNVTEYLVERGADVDLQDEDGMSPLHYAAENGRLDIVKYFVERRANVNLRNEDGMSPLHTAIQSGHLNVTEYLVERGANVDLQDEDGMSPLHYAAENGRLDIVK
ncbi:MAG: ankyrin repeat domain-containing protein, partial [Wolbachia endosymbiont of Homalodisca vitripennis]|nr:ankyrin repeat domain-containing protein [Wolbachia endosymbiont of Homalodisca vitripennis]MCJ7476276.1 ankyrin repeat domain-containing protein [Wolbachia endosymbiont of Homalodisca vitripennis]